MLITFRSRSLICSKNCWSCDHMSYQIFANDKPYLKKTDIATCLTAIPLFEAPCADQFPGSSPIAGVLQHSIPQVLHLSSAYKENMRHHNHMHWRLFFPWIMYKQGIRCTWVEGLLPQVAHSNLRICYVLTEKIWHDCQYQQQNQHASMPQNNRLMSFFYNKKERQNAFILHVLNYMVMLKIFFQNLS